MANRLNAPSQSSSHKEATELERSVYRGIFLQPLTWAAIASSSPGPRYHLVKESRVIGDQSWLPILTAYSFVRGGPTSRIQERANNESQIRFIFCCRDDPRPLFNVVNMSVRSLSILLFLTTILGDLISIGSTERMSGLYVDNGFDQTVVHRVVTQREKRELEHEFLNLLGLPDRPRNTIGNPPQVKRSAPKFLLDIYENTLGENEEEKHATHHHRKVGEFDLTGQDLKAIDQSDVIMTFAAHNHHVPGVRHERGKRLWFDVSEVPPREHIIGAELRLYRGADVKGRKNHGSHTITVYRVLKTGNGTRELQYVDAINITTSQQGWQTLNITEALDHWVNNPDGNRGLYLSVHPADRLVHEVRPEDIGIVEFRGDPDKQPFMVGYFKSSGIRESKIRQKRDARRKKKSESTSWDYRTNPYTDTGATYYSRTCRIQTLYVSFRDLQWQDWIIAPDGYDAYYCSGDCNFPLNAHMNATNHAIVQTLVHLVSPGKVPKPCCAPTKLSAISVLYFLDESNVILKKYKNMVVKSCGCH